MKHLLFVDADPATRDAVARLRTIRPEWQIVLATDAAAARASIAQCAPDVVMIDVDGERGEGIELLRDTRHTMPLAIRIALTRASGRTATMRAATVAHQCLGKPCAAGFLADVVGRSLAVQTELRHPDLVRAVHGVTALPSPPRTYLALTEALADPEISLDLVAKTVAEDPALSAKVLQLVNSAYFGPSRPMSSLRQATVFVGLSRLKQLVLGAEVFGTAGADGRTSAAELLELQRHAVLVARLAAEVVDPLNAEPAFTAGLLHDIGDLVLLGRRATATAADASAIELHARVGAYLAAVWGLPTGIVEALLWHHRPSRGELTEFGIAGTVHVANALAEMLVATDDAARARALEHALDRRWLEMVGCGHRLDEWREKGFALARVDGLVPALSA